MHELLFDLSLVKKVWCNIAQNDDAQFAAKRAEIQDRYHELLVKAFSEGPSLNAEAFADARTLPSQELAESSYEAVKDILDFVDAAFCFYLLVKSKRPFTAEEKAMGDALGSLLKQAQLAVPPTTKGVADV